MRLDPIEDRDLPAVARFFADHIPLSTDPELWPDVWRRSVNVPTTVDALNHGFLLRHGTHIVGAYLAMYSQREIDGRVERFCNLAGWCVHPDYRMHGLRLLRALLDQPGWHFTDLFPSPAVQRVNSRLGFTLLDTTAALVPNLPWPSRPCRTVISADPVVIERALQGEDLRRYHDHAVAPSVRHLVLFRAGRPCHVMVRREWRWGVPLFASIIYASDPEVLRWAYRPLTRYLLLRVRTVATIVELRIAGGRLRPSLLLRNHRPKMYRSATLGPDKIDYLYSELTSAP